MIAGADYIVVGAGPGGCAVASRLAAARPDRIVVLLETGPSKPSVLTKVPLGIAGMVAFRGRHNYAYLTEPQPQLGGRRGYQPRGRGVGGSSLINAMIYVRGQPEDYDEWDALGASGWSWKEVLPYFRRAESNARGADARHGGDGPLRVEDLREPNPATQAFIEAAKQAGFRYNSDFNGPDQQGVGAYQVFQREGRRFSAADAYLGEDRSRYRNLIVLGDTKAVRICFDGRRASGVVVRKGNEDHVIEAREEIVLAAGAFGTPQLLMASGVGPAFHLRDLGIPVIADRREVGANLQDHIDYTINVRSGAAGLFGLSAATAAAMPAAISRWRRGGRGMLTSNVAEAGGFLKTDPLLGRPDVQLHFCLGIVDDHNRKLHIGRGYSIHVCALRPHSRGTVRLTSPDMRDAPAIDPAFLSDPRDLDTLVKGVKIAQRIMVAPALAALGGKPVYGSGRDDDATLRTLIRDHADTIYHPVGTCRMGSDENAVVDAQLRVQGVTGLRIADASIMPRLISGNTQAPTAMIGERASDLILGRNSAAISPMAA
ncbi:MULTISPECIES: GMC family oxidoreductase [Sphingomonas]|jgi:choline dehydrogenase-like flavoprotein|nr:MULTISPECIES: GMC family oxidoreductase N-terminal domain-containing protein [Sphingomonas]MBB4050000.1 choline dehydrogenase-like flavoprotein [Sphingomonas zeae]MDK8184253.1 GMC family oxidoreductase N-terminal domain-containing protein [Sphingomonas zeae]MDK8214657.1 GMC family oxidoreductase N-terminal domain-containing protein [Sphingomonas sp. UMB7805-LC452B]